MPRDCFSWRSHGRVSVKIVAARKGLQPPSGSAVESGLASMAFGVCRENRDERRGLARPRTPRGKSHLSGALLRLGRGQLPNFLTRRNGKGTISAIRVAPGITVFASASNRSARVVLHFACHASGEKVV